MVCLATGFPDDRFTEGIMQLESKWEIRYACGDPKRPPAFHFNSCRLTVRGEQLARQLLEQHPEYRRSTGDGCRAGLW